MLNEFIVRGTSRRIGAIGVMEPFEVTVTSPSVDEACEDVRDSLYDEGREHVLITSVRVAS